MSRDVDCERNDWPEYRMTLVRHMDDCRSNQAEQERFNLEVIARFEAMSKRVDDAHNEGRWLREKLVYVATGVGAMISALWGLISDNWREIFK